MPVKVRKLEINHKIKTLHILIFPKKMNVRKYKTFFESESSLKYLLKHSVPSDLMASLVS